MAAAGGVAGDPARVRVSYRPARRHAVAGELTLCGLIADPGSSANIELAAGDAVNVRVSPHATVIGEVAPGVYEIMPGATLAQVVAQAGGMA